MRGKDSLTEEEGEGEIVPLSGRNFTCAPLEERRETEMRLTLKAGTYATSLRVTV